MHTLTSTHMGPTSMAVSAAARCPGVRAALPRAAVRASCSMRQGCRTTGSSRPGPLQPCSEVNINDARRVQHLSGEIRHANQPQMPRLMSADSMGSTYIHAVPYHVLMFAPVAGLGTMEGTKSQRFLCRSTNKDNSNGNGNGAPPAPAAASNGGQQQQGRKDSYEYDLVVIGGGSGGVRAARASAQLGEWRWSVHTPCTHACCAVQGGVCMCGCHIRTCALHGGVDVDEHTVFTQLLMWWVCR
jgi:hypothetical protein